MASTSTAMKPLQNIYYERKVATERPCYICKRPTLIVLATIDTKDFLYTCDSHLSDSGFATLISPAPAPPGMSEEEIRKVVAEYKAREAKKAENVKDKTDDGNKDNEKDNGKEKDRSKPSSPSPVPAASSPAPTGSASHHRKFALHRQIFDMRRDDIKRKEQGVKAREVGKGLPQVPRGMF